MIDPVFWLGLSILLVAVSLTAVLVVAIPALQELARAARSAEKLFDTLSRELPPTLESIRLTGLEISDLTDDMSEGVKSAGQVVKQVDQSLDGVKKQAQKVQSSTRSLFTGVQVAWKTFTKTTPASRRSVGRLPPPSRPSLETSSSYRLGTPTPGTTSELPSDRPLINEEPSVDLASDRRHESSLRLPRSTDPGLSSESPGSPFSTAKESVEPDQPPTKPHASENESV